MAEPKYVEVAPAIPLSATGPQTYTYRTLKKAPGLYAQVQVPFGKRRIAGVVVKVHNKASRYPTKPLGSLSSVRLTAQQITLAQWMARTMHGSLGYTARLFFPPVKPKNDFSIAPVSRRTQPITHPTAVIVDRDYTKRLRQLAWLIKKTVSKSQQVLVIVPEKWMVARVVELLAKSLSRDVVGYHSDLTPKQRTGLWQRVGSGESIVVVSTQKGVYLPWRDLALVALEEEAFKTHKLWDAYPRLDNRYVARQLADIYNCPQVLMGSMPSVGLYNDLASGATVSFHRADWIPQPSVIASSFDDKHRRRPIPHEALTRLRGWLKANEKIVLLVSRRDPKLVETLKKALPKTKIAELKANGCTLPDAQLIVGTSAVFAVAADTTIFDRAMFWLPERALSYPDFRSEDNATYLLVRLQQLLPPRRRVTVVTRRPDVIAEQLTAPLAKRYERQLKERQRLGLPPFTDLVKLTVERTTKKAAQRDAEKVREAIAAAKPESVTVFGPFNELGPKAAEQPVKHLLLQGPLEELVPLYEKLPKVTADLSPERIV